MEEQSEQRKNNDDDHEQIELKLGNFWVWIKKSEHSEGGHGINWDKRIPGVASVFAVIIFLVKEFIHHESDKGEIFTDLHFTIFLQALNIVILVIILVRGLTILPISKSAFSSWFTSGQIDHVELLEKEFIKFIRAFFTMTIMLYGVLIFNSLFLDAVNGSMSEKKVWLKNIQAGHREIVSNADSISHDLGRQNSPYLAAFTGPLDTISKSMQLIIYNDSPAEAPGTVFVSRLHKIRRANEFITEALLHMDDSLIRHRNEKSSVSEKIEREINCMYHGNHIIGVNAQIAEKDDIEMIIIHVLELIFSNLGALFLVYAFLIIYTKNLIPSKEDGDGEQSLLSVRYVLTGLHGRQSKEITNLLKTLLCIFIILTISQILLECCFRENADDIATLFTMISGIFNALALSLLVARFESSSFFSTFSVLVILYLYANIQVLFGVFNIPLFRYPHLIEDVTLLIAFVGKCSLYLYILWILRTDRLKYYFYNRYFNKFGSQNNLKWREFVRRMNPASKKLITHDSDSGLRPAQN